MKYKLGRYRLMLLADGSEGASCSLFPTSRAQQHQPFKTVAILLQLGRRPYIFTNNFQVPLIFTVYRERALLFEKRTLVWSFWEAACRFGTCLRGLSLW